MRFHTHKTQLHQTLAVAAVIALSAAAPTAAAERTLTCLPLRAHAAVSGPTQGATSAKAGLMPARAIRLGR
jgi:hypothetical protein